MSSLAFHCKSDEGAYALMLAVFGIPVEDSPDGKPQVFYPHIDAANKYIRGTGNLEALDPHETRESRIEIDPYPELRKERPAQLKLVG